MPAILAVGRYVKTTDFPAFKTITLEDREVIQDQLWAYQPETSELTFTNLFIWRDYYGARWSVHKDWLIIVYNKARSRSVRAAAGWPTATPGSDSPGLKLARRAGRKKATH